MVHIYYMNLSGDCSYEQSLALYRLLPEERKQKVKSAKQENAARHRLYIGAFLQYVLSQETGIPMEHISYVYGSHGKPEIDYRTLEEGFKVDNANGKVIVYDRLCFNLSHSGEYVVLAVSDKPVGIDIEYKSRNYQSVAKRCFCQEEYKDIMEVEDSEEQKKRFLQYWTMKEAFIKHSGKGMSVPLNSFRIIRQDLDLSFIESSDLCFATLFLGEEPYCISLCSESQHELTKMKLKKIILNNIESNTTD